MKHINDNGNAQPSISPRRISVVSAAYSQSLAPHRARARRTAAKALKAYDRRFAVVSDDADRQAIVQFIVGDEDNDCVELWGPLRTYVMRCGLVDLTKYMSMGGDVIHIYKHTDTRRSLYLDRDGYAYLPGPGSTEENAWAPVSDDVAQMFAESVIWELDTDDAEAARMAEVAGMCRRVRLFAGRNPSVRCADFAVDGPTNRPDIVQFHACHSGRPLALDPQGDPYVPSGDDWVCIGDDYAVSILSDG